MSWEARNKDHTGEELVFQTLDCYCDDFENDKGYPVYKIFVFGVDTTGIPITLCIEDYSPFFFIEVPITWNNTCVWSVKEALNNRSIKTIEFLERKRYYGFENNKIRKFLKLSFYSSRGMRNVKYKIEKETFQIGGKEYQFELYESNIDPILRFTHIRDILTAGWIKVTNFTFEEHFVCSWNNVSSYNENELLISDIRVMYFDIEACSEDGSFPNALKKNDRVTQICCILKDTVTKKIQKFLFNLGTCDPVEDTTVLQYPSEKKMLLAYRQFIVDTDPDVIVGYNIFGFDNGFLFERAKVLEIEETFNYQSKLSIKRTTIQEKILNNQQSGFNNWKMTKIYGRTHIDLLQVIKKDFKLESYKLDYVGEYFLKEGKDDVTPKQIFEAWDPKLGNREKRTIVGKYCVQDTNLCLLLFEKFAVLPNHLEMAKVTRVPLEYLITRGQSIKVFSQIAYETRKAGFLIPILPKMETDSKFQGATVLEAHVGYYTKPVCGLDFASLYPSIMIAHNMCYSTVVLDKRYLNIPGIEYSTIKCNESLSVSFVQNQPGVLSGILQSLWKNRKVTKKEMNATKDPFLKTVLNAKQLAIKVSMNSIYGFTGATVGALPCLEISQSVTGCGRLMIEQTQHHAKEMFQCEIVYGDTDSCYVIFPQPVDPDGTLTTLFKVAENAAKKISETFKKPIELEFEKFMYPLILVAKKRYMYLEWTDPKNHNGEIEAKGVELVRRDNCPYVKETLDAILSPIMFENNVQKGVDAVKRCIDTLFQGKVPIKKFILSKTLKNEYKGFEKKYSQRLPDGRPDTNGEYTWIHTKEIKVKEDGKNVKTGTFEKIQETPNMGHVALVERMRERDPNGAPKPGDRIPFVYIDTGNPKDTSAQKTEDPVFVQENNIPIDSLYYFDHQIASPIETIMTTILGAEKCEDLLYKNKSYLEAKKKEKNALGEYKRKKEGNRDIRNFFTIKMK